MLKKFLSYYKRHKKLLILDLICVLLMSLVDIIFPYLTRYIIKNKIDNINKIFFFLVSITIT